jgi:hypothetical protein
MHTFTTFGPFELAVNPSDGSYEVNSLDSKHYDLVDILFSSRDAAQRILDRQRQIASEEIQDEEFFDYAEHYRIASLAEDGFPNIFRIVDDGRDNADIAMIVFDPEEERLMRETLIRSVEIERSILEAQFEAMHQNAQLNVYDQVAA